MIKGTALGRVLSGSFAAWVRIGLALVLQIVATPLYLAHWSVPMYGAWLTFVAATSFLQLLDTGHQNYLQAEFYRLGAARSSQIQHVLTSSIPIALCLGLVEAITVLVFGDEALRHGNFGIPPGLLSDIKILLLLHVGLWTIFGSIAGLVNRSLCVFGYYSRFEWWSVLVQTIAVVAPLIATIAGGTLIQAGLTMLCAVACVNIAVGVDLLRCHSAANLRWVRPNAALGSRNFFLSLVLTLKATFELLRSQGVRLILAPLAGTASMAAFATMRTGANVALQGLSTVTNPLTPELMRFIHEKDGGRAASTICVTWAFVVFLLCPSVLVLQYFAPQLFEIWLRGRIRFDPPLFALLSSNVLIYAIAQPPLSVLQGNNRLRDQIAISSSSALVVVIAMLFSVRSYGLIGAAASLIAGESVSLLLSVWRARVWLRKHHLDWPSRAFRTVLLGVIVASVGSLALGLNTARSPLGLGLLMLAMLAVGRSMWDAVPEIAKVRLSKIAISFMTRKYV